MLFGLRSLVSRLHHRTHRKSAQLDPQEAEAQQKAYQKFLKHWHEPNQAPPWKQQPCQCMTEAFHRHHHQEPHRPSAWEVRVQVADDIVRQAKLQLHSEENAWKQRRWDLGEVEALRVLRVVEDRVAAAEQARQQLALGTQRCC